LKHPPEENYEIYHGCPNTHMRDPVIRQAFDAMVKETKKHLSLHMNENAPHFSSKETRIAYNEFKEGK
jgi:hypothetical protein